MNTDNERKQERLRIRRDRERQARAQETAEEKVVRLAKRKQQSPVLKTAFHKRLCLYQHLQYFRSISSNRV